MLLIELKLGLIYILLAFNGLATNKVLNYRYFLVNFNINPSDMKTVQQLLNTKAVHVYSVTPETSVLEALKVMLEKNISALIVQDHEKLLGIFTERDYARKIILKGKSSSETPISDVMTANMVTIKPEDSIESCMEMMTEKHIRHLPVVVNDQVMAMVSIGDVVKFIIADQKQTINALESYINS